MASQTVMGSQANKPKKGGETGIPNTITVYFVSLPTNETHNNHSVGPDIAFVPKVHPLMITKISDLVS